MKTHWITMSRQCTRGSVIAILALVLGAESAGAAAVLDQKVLSVSVATQGAQAAVAACRNRGFHISVAVTDQDGLVRVLLRGDGAGPHTLDSSAKKAYTAASLGVSTGVLTKIMVEHPEATGLRDMNDKILIMQGGLPITTGGETIGGIGVGGTPGGDTDEACARAGLDTIMERLSPNPPRSSGSPD